MSAEIQLLPWDSDLMGFPVARLSLDRATADEIAQAITDCRAVGQHLLYVVVQMADDTSNRAVQATGAWLADRKVTFAMPLNSADAALLPDPAIVLAIEFTPELEALAWQSGEYSRFRLDPRLPITVFQRLYTQWLRNSLNGSIARSVMVLQGATGESLGLATLGEKSGVADIGLIAVEAAARGQQVGQRLMAEARRRAAAIGFTQLQVITQGENQQACRFYEKCGLTQVDEVYIYHLWLR